MTPPSPLPPPSSPPPPSPEERKTLPDDSGRWARGDWDYNPGDHPHDWKNDATKDAPWEAPSILRRLIGTPEELEAVADAIVRGYEITATDPKDNERVIVGVVGDADGPWVLSHGIGEHVVVENLKALIKAVQAHPAVRLAKVKTEEDADGHLRVLRRWVEDREGTELAEDTEPTELRLWHSVVARTAAEGEDYGGLDIGVTLRPEARFVGVASFSGARFAGDAEFWEARFAGDAWFWKARFAGDARFREARFAGVAWFWEARFAGDADFWEARFAGDARFREARFAGVARFREARFAGVAKFWEARFAGDAWFREARFAGDAWFRGARFAGDADFGEARFGIGCTVEGDFRRADVRKAQIPGLSQPEREEDEETSGWVRRACRVVLSRCSKTIARAWAAAGGVGWTTVRSIGELSVLTRVSVLALIFVPPLASAWPAIRAGIVEYNSAVTDISERFEGATTGLHEAAAVLADAEAVPGVDPAAGERVQRLTETIGGVEQSIDEWSGRFARMTRDDQNLPLSLAIAFFAAAFITIAQLLYQARVPPLLRKHDEDSFVEWVHTRYAENSPDRNDGLRRACDNLAAAARLSPRRHASLITHHGETVWVPPKERIEWFEDIEPRAVEGTDEARPASATPTYPKGYLPGPERARIAIEEGARAEYWMVSRERLIGAWFCFVLYAIGLTGLLVILVVQGWQVLQAAGWGQ